MWCAGAWSATKPAENGERRTFLHRGIATRAFERRFELADHIKVEGARLINGLLHVELKREVPEEKKPRRIAINQGQPPAIEHQNNTGDATQAA